MNCTIKPPFWSASRVKASAGFTLAEVLAAMLFMAIVIPVAIQGLRISSQAGVVAERSSIALHLGEALINELAIGGRYREVGASGDFGFEWAGYRWEAQVEPWGREAMRLLHIDIFFPAQNQERSVRLSTLVSE
jgi:type II secretory pathway pseudopilin PulG